MSYRDRRDSYGSRDRGERRSTASSSRRSSPSPPPKPRSEKDLPESFGRIQEIIKDDDSNVLQRMTKKFVNAPLGSLTKCLEGQRKIKVWTRNFKEVRGICTGYVIAFDKHWNLVMADVDEVYLKRKKHKTPCFEDLQTADNFEELPPKVPKQRKDANSVEAQESQPAAEAATMEVETAATDVDKAATITETAVTEMEVVATEVKGTSAEDQAATTEDQDVTTEDQDAAAKSDAPNTGEKKKKKKRRRKKKSSAPKKRHMKQIFIRGDSIVMAAILDEVDKN